MARGICGLLALAALSATVAAAADSNTEYPNFLEAFTRPADASKMMERMAQTFINAATQNEGVKMMERAIGSVVDPTTVHNLFVEANRGARSFLNPFEALWGMSMSQFQNRAAEGNADGSVSETTPQRVFPFFFPFTGASPAAKYGPRYEFHDHIYECGGRPCDESWSVSHSYSHSHSVSREE
ncbi:hypothetical protein BESB_028610 [Besnoitia besnoiti]|uniref:Transmembrane protein n=1 Tax=Besnoitia besnoiti TaxID=94643 RepID=A0A2A9M6C1_BESBE|nr:uncharacterized protein BESB_028610 [Besnoitia besnoiti]PFH31426.1 hypothetical protein BESB_028610 [Besnoitia besnoiti]